MSAFAGVVTLDGAPIGRQTEDALVRAVHGLRKGRPATRRHDGALFAQQPPFIGGGGQGELLTSRGGRTIFAALARLDNREELGAALGLTPAELAQAADTALILRMIERWGDAGVARCLGAFAFALWDADARRLILGRDCLGNRPLFFHATPGFVAFATTLNALLALPDVPREIDELALAHYLAENLGEGRRTFYRGIERVPSRTIVTIDRTGVSGQPYWAPDVDAPPLYRHEDDYIERARELLDQAVASAIRDTPHVAISASGGLDSSAIAATAARLRIAESITCFSLVPPVGTQIDVGPFKYLDERDKLEALARMHPALGLRLISTESLHPFRQRQHALFRPQQLARARPRQSRIVEPPL
jgi:asparagine synthase (glutamine-hydrolysing)